MPELKSFFSLDVFPYSQDIVTTCNYQTTTQVIFWSYLSTRANFQAFLNIFFPWKQRCNIEERLFENTYLAELVHNKFAHCHEFLLKVPPTSNDAFVSPCFHVQDWSVDHLRVKGSDCSNCLHRANSCTKLTFGLSTKCIIVVGLRGLKNPPFL